MKGLKVATIVGARPQFIKAAAISRAIACHNATCPERPMTEVLIHTGQHYDCEMSGVFFRDLGLPEPAHHLAVGSGPHGAQTGEMLKRVEATLLDERPELVLVHGDTNSTLAGALAAAKLHMPVAHVEAGLRSYNRYMPEEINRVVTDHLSTWLFCPTETAVKNLGREGLAVGVHLVGDVMYESLLHNLRPAGENSRVLESLGLRPDGYALATVHRAENTEDPVRLRAIFTALGKISEMLPVLCPLHPRTRRALTVLGPDGLAFGLRLIDPLDYFDMLQAEHHARVVLTDSGGVQKEAYWLGVPCVTLRDETEWVETLEEGRNILTGADSDRIVAVVERVLQCPRFSRPSVKPIGAAQAIVGRLLDVRE